MADQQPGATDPAAGMPEPTKVESGAPAPDPTRVEDVVPAGSSTPSAREPAREEPTTAEAPARWRGSAAVPTALPKKAWWSRRPAILDPANDDDDWAATPAVDPWADQDTPWMLFPPPTRTQPPAPPAWPRTDVLPTEPEAAPIKPAAAGPAPGRRRWGHRQPAPQPVGVNRLPVQPRPSVAPQKPPYLPPPPAWRPPASGPPRPPLAARPPAAPAKGPTGRPSTAQRPAPPRRKRRWGRRLLLFTLLSAVCCVGIPGYFAWPAAQQYPVSAVLPQSVADLSLRDDNSGRRAANRLRHELGNSNLPGQGVFAGVYADDDGKQVTVFGTTGLRLTPDRDLKTELARIAGEYDLTDTAPFDVGETGAHERCGVGRSDGAGVVVCGWADHGSLATVLLTRRSITDSAQLVGVLRGAVLIPRWQGGTRS